MIQARSCTKCERIFPLLFRLRYCFIAKPVTEIQPSSFTYKLQYEVTVGMLHTNQSVTPYSN